MPNKNSITLADVLEAGFERYAQRYGPLPAEQYKVAHAIMRCHTPWLGGRINRCECCGHEVTVYNSCRNRHCPACQAQARMAWVERRLEQMLPVPYFHLVFTLPEQLRDIALRNRKPLYSIMFRAVNELLSELAANPRRLGGTIGFVAVLHTWTQTLQYHPHLHVVVPGGGLSADRTRWKQAPARYLFPVEVMRTLFRAKVLDYLRRAVDSGEVHMHGAIAMYDNPNVFSQLLSQLYTQEWVVYAKPPFGSPEQVVKYLGAYTHRVAISNRRIVALEPDFVTFSYKDRRDDNREKLMRLPIVEFIRRFMLHLVPARFVRIRHYGLLGNRMRRTLLPLCLQLLGVAPEPGQQEHHRWDQRELLVAVSGIDPNRCPKCAKGRLVLFERLAPLWSAAAA
jgi:hypothetical protein